MDVENPVRRGGCPLAREVQGRVGMAAKRSTARPKDPISRAQFNERFREMGVLMERIDSNVRVVAEGLTAHREEFKRDMAALEARLTVRIENLEAAVRQNSADIRKNSEDIRKNSEDIRKNSEDIRKNSEDIRTLRAELAQLRHDFDHRAERAQLVDIEKRVTALEARAGVTPT
jgi:DNA repair ATPase RecN